MVDVNICTPSGPADPAPSRPTRSPDALDRWTSQHLGRPGDAVLAALTGLLDGIGEELTAARWALPASTVHGDAHTGNLLRTEAGRPVLCDLDSVSQGPAEVDLGPAAHAVSRFGRDPGDYARLAATYGFDVRESPAWPALRRLRDLQLAVYLLPQLPDGPPAAELAHRLRTVLTADATARWSRFPRMA
jgi:Ser/Thr protein kinase RdoA (MazF antagonist)